MQRSSVFVAGVDFEAFENDEELIDAVIHNLTVIGEAANHVPSEITGRHPDIPWRQMVDLRNFSVHAYWNLRPSVIWDTIQPDLPPLVAPLRQEQSLWGLAEQKSAEMAQHRNGAVLSLDGMSSRQRTAPVKESFGPRSNGIPHAGRENRATSPSYGNDEYDGMGRIKRSSQVIDGQPYLMSYLYDRSGNMTSQTRHIARTLPHGRGSDRNGGMRTCLLTRDACKVQ